MLAQAEKLNGKESGPAFIVRNYIFLKTKIRAELGFARLFRFSTM
jgi:hypothetical protein